MARFEFRLQRLLEYRELQEGWAKDAYLEARAKTLQAEQEIVLVQGRRHLALRRPPATLNEKLSLQEYLSKLDDDERALEAAHSVLEGEEEVARLEWLRARSDHEALVKLREKEYEAYRKQQDRKEQGELDEWAVFRRAA